MSGARLLAIVRREYLERVRTRGFVIGTVLVPAFMAGMLVLPLLMARQTGKPLRVAVIDPSGRLQAEAEQALRAARFDDKPRFLVSPAPAGPPDERQSALRQEALEGRLDGYVVLEADVVETGTASYYGRHVANRIDLRTLERSLGDLLVGVRLQRLGLEPRRLQALTRPLELRTIRISETGEREDRGAGLMAAIVLLTLLYAAIMTWGQVVMQGVIEEKGSRVIEVLASSVPATLLLSGKLVGIGAAGFTQLLVWALSLLLLSLGSGGISLGSLSLPELTPLALVSFVLFFVLGFVLYASLFAAIGAAVNSVQEAQNLVVPMMLPLVVGLVCFPVVLQAPDSGLAIALSLLPPLAPLLMFLRIVVLTPPAWQIALSLLLLLLAIAGSLWLSARIYRVGILMYGKRPTFPEILRWVRHR